MSWHGNECLRIDLVFDRYRDTSIKESTRNQRTKNQRAIRKDISGREIPVPQNWPNFLACPINKSDNADFISEQIKLLKEIFSKVIVTSGGFKDELEVWSSKDNIDITKLSSTHEEADTRLILYAIN